MSNSLSDMLLGLTLLLTIIVTVKSRPDVPPMKIQKNLPKAGYLPGSEGNLSNGALLGGNRLRQVTEDSKSNIDLNISAGLREHDPFADEFQNIELLLEHFWNIQNITYKVLNYPRYLKKTDVDIEIARAFAAWSEYANLTFTPKDAGEVDIRIEFLAKDHGDFPFDGRGASLAHANTSEDAAYVHFDNDEYWTINSTNHYDYNEYKTNNSTAGLDLFRNAVHEIGHILGLDHSIRGNVMFYMYEGYEPNFKLGQLDIEGVQYLYGSKSSPSINGPFVDFAVPRNNKTFVELLRNIQFDKVSCDDPKIDAVFNSADNQTYIFKSNKYYKLSRYSAADGYPKLISDGWPGLPSDIDAAFEYRDGKTYFFKGTKYWRYNGSQMDEGYPKEISEGFLGVPNDLDTALVWDDGGKIYFFKGNKFWSFDPTKKPSVKSNYIRSYTNWKFLPLNLDAAFLDLDGFTYFFKNEDFYQIDAKKSAVLQKIKSFTTFEPHSICSTIDRCIDYLVEEIIPEDTGKVKERRRKT